MTESHSESERRRQLMRERLAQLHNQTLQQLTPEQQYARHERDYRLLLATLDGDEDTANRVLDDEPDDLTPEMRAAFKQNALAVVQQMEDEHGREQARRLLDAALTQVLDAAEQHRDPFGHTLQQLTNDDLNAELQKLDGEDGN